MRKIAFGNDSHVGSVRSENQDSFGKFPEGNVDLNCPGGQLFVIADGMGGQNAGREASTIAVREIGAAYYSGTDPSVIGNLRRAFSAANEAIYRKSGTGPQYRGMGTTCVVLVLRDGHAYIGNIGDSRAYKITQRGITQLTQDHSKVAEMVRRGIITHEEARNHPERSHLYRAMGPRPSAEVDFFDDMPLSSSRHFLLCTDGLFNHVEDEEMRQIVTSNTPERACRRLIELANERGGSDNITVQVVRVDVNAPALSPLSRSKEKLKFIWKTGKK